MLLIGFYIGKYQVTEKTAYNSTN